MKDNIKAILKDFYRSRPDNAEAHCQLIRHCAPEVPASHVEAVLKEFAAEEYSLEGRDSAAEKILSYKPEVKKKEKYQTITEE